MTAPEVGRSSPAIKFSKDDFPEPELPSSATNSPAPTWSEIPSTARITESPTLYCRQTDSVRIVPARLDFSVIVMRNPWLLDPRGVKQYKAKPSRPAYEKRPFS